MMRSSLAAVLVLLAFALVLSHGEGAADGTEGGTAQPVTTAAAGGTSRGWVERLEKRGRKITHMVKPFLHVADDIGEASPKSNTSSKDATATDENSWGGTLQLPLDTIIDVHTGTIPKKETAKQKREREEQGLPSKPRVVTWPLKSYIRKGMATRFEMGKKLETKARIRKTQLVFKLNQQKEVNEKKGPLKAIRQEHKAKVREWDRITAMKRDLIYLQTHAENQRISFLKQKRKESKMKMGEENQKAQATAAFKRKQAAMTTKMQNEKQTKLAFVKTLNDHQREIYTKTDEAIQKEEKAENTEARQQAAFRKVEVRYEREDALNRLKFDQSMKQWRHMAKLDYRGRESMRDNRNQICDLRAHTSAMNRVRHSANVMLDSAKVAARDRAQSRGMDAMEEMYATWHDRERSDKALRKLGGKKATCPKCEMMFEQHTRNKKGDIIKTRTWKGPSPCATEILLRKNKGKPEQGIPADPTLRDCKQEAQKRAEDFWQSKERYNKYVERLGEVRKDWIEHSDAEKKEKMTQKRERFAKSVEVRQKKKSFKVETKTFVEEQLASIDRLEKFVSGLLPQLKAQEELAVTFHASLALKYNKLKPAYYAEKKTKHAEKFTRAELDRVQTHSSETLVKSKISAEPISKKQYQQHQRFAEIMDKNLLTVKENKDKAALRQSNFVAAQMKEQAEKDSQMEKWAAGVRRYKRQKRAAQRKKRALAKEHLTKRAQLQQKRKVEIANKKRRVHNGFTKKRKMIYAATMLHLKQEQVAAKKKLKEKETLKFEFTKDAATFSSKAANMVTETAHLMKIGSLSEQDANKRTKAAEDLSNQAVMTSQKAMDVATQITYTHSVLASIEARMDKAKLNYTEGIKSRGCDWLTCRTAGCDPCDKGFITYSRPVPFAGKCQCQCSCEEMGPFKKPDNMAWVTKREKKTVKTFGMETRATIQTQGAVCKSSSGRTPVGCLKGRLVPSNYYHSKKMDPIPVTCGCDKIFYLQGFQFDTTFPKVRATDETTFAAGFWRQAIPFARYRRQLTEYMRLCLQRQLVTPAFGPGLDKCPVVKKYDYNYYVRQVHEDLLHARAIAVNGTATKAKVGKHNADVAQETLLQISAKAVDDKAQSDESLVTREKNRKAEYKTATTKIKMNNERIVSVTNVLNKRSMDVSVNKWVKDGFMDPRKTGFMYTEVVKSAQSFADAKLMGKDATEQALFDHQKCYQKFISMWSVCGNHRGTPVTLYCRLKANGPIVTINNAGCHCPKLAVAEFEGHMLETQRMDPCIHYYIKWAAEARNKFMATSVMRGCAMQLERACSAQRKAVKEKRALAVKKNDMTEQRNLRPLNKLVRKYDEHLKQEQGTLQKLHYTLAHPSYHFHRIPGLAVTGKESVVDSKAACQTACNLGGSCKSFSYNTLTNKCFVSEQTLQFDPDWSMYLKPKDPQLHGEFFTVPGMKALDDEPMDEKDAELTSFGECKYACFKNEDCSGFSYNQVTKACMGAGTVVYEPNFSYYEKQGVLEGGSKRAQEDMRQRLSSENAQKEVLKKEWIAIVEMRNQGQKPVRKTKEKVVEKHEAELGDSQGAARSQWHTMKVKGVVLGEVQELGNDSQETANLDAGDDIGEGVDPMGKQFYVTTAGSFQLARGYQGKGGEELLQEGEGEGQRVGSGGSEGSPFFLTRGAWHHSPGLSDLAPK